MRLRLRAKGRRNTPQTIGSARPKKNGAAEADALLPVAIATLRVPVIPELSVMVDGLKVQVEFAGRPLHVNVKVPEEPDAGLMARV